MNKIPVSALEHKNNRGAKTCNISNLSKVCSAIKML
jgi:hypothetical protein